MISVVIPCHNCIPFIKRAVTSVLNQEFQDYELILIDNRSTDGTIHILNHYREAYPEKISVYHEYKKGAPAARNKGLFAARGEWIQFLDADDELHPEKLACQAALTKDSQASVIIGDYILKKDWNGSSENKYSIKDAWRGLITSNLGVTSSNLWRKRDLALIDGWNEDLTSSQEYDLLFRLLKRNSRLVFDPSLSTTVYRYNNSISRSDNKKKLVEIIRNRIKLRLDIKEHLTNTEQLTQQLNSAIDTYIYLELKTNSWRIPEYTDAFLRQNTLDVPLDLILKTNFRLKLKRWLSYQQLSRKIFPVF